MADFYPPLLNQSVVRFCQGLAHPLGYWRYRMTLDVEEDDLELLRSLRDERVLLLPNHPTFHDWIAIFLLSAHLQQSFYYLAAYERFQGKGRRGLQWLGAYSIRRGLGDRASVQKTVELLTQPGSQIVVFPEGGCSFQNDTVMPFREGSVQVAMQALNRLHKRGNPLPNLYAVPVSLKYRYTSPMDRVIHRALARLERSLQLPLAPSSAPDGFYIRLRAIAEIVLTSCENAYGLSAHSTTGLTWNERLLTIRTHILQSCEHTLGLHAPAHLPIRERVYRIQHSLEARAEHLTAEELWTYETIHKAAARLLNFDAIYDGYVAAHPTPERYLDTIVRIEREVFGIGEPVPKGHRKVMLRLGEPINLRDHFDAYRTHKAPTITRLTHQLHQTVQDRLDQLNREDGRSPSPVQMGH